MKLTFIEPIKCLLLAIVKITFTLHNNITQYYLYNYFNALKIYKT